MMEQTVSAPRFQSSQLAGGWRRLIWPLGALGAVLLFNYFFTAGFFNVVGRDGHLYGSLIDVFARATPVMLLSLGMTFVIATGGVDLSVGAVCALAAAVSAITLQGGPAGLGQAFTYALLAALAAGVWNAALVAWLEVQPIVATLVLMVAGRGVAQLLTGGQIVAIDHPGFQYLGRGFLFGLPFRISLLVFVTAALALLSRRTAVGLYVESVGNSPVASRYAGVHSGMVKAFVYALSGLCAGLAGLIIASDIGAADVNNAGLNLELDAILAVVVGGTALTGGRFSLIGSIIGALIIQSVTTTINMRGIPVELTLVIKAVVILSVCLLQSEALRKRLLGRFGRKV
jgi:simple sugar transport system permease protein